MQRDGNYTGLWVRIEINSERLIVKDNCGGIPVDIARNYAFRFGRPKESPSHTRIGWSIWGRNEKDLF